MPVAAQLRAADIDPDEFGPDFLRESFGRRELLTAIYLQPEAFGRAAQRALEPLEGRLTHHKLFFDARPAFVLWDDSEIPMGYVAPIRERLERAWRRELAPTAP